MTTQLPCVYGPAGTRALLGFLARPGGSGTTPRRGGSERRAEMAPTNAGTANGRFLSDAGRRHTHATSQPLELPGGGPSLGGPDGRSVRARQWAVAARPDHVVGGVAGVGATGAPPGQEVEVQQPLLFRSGRFRALRQCHQLAPSRPSGVGVTHARGRKGEAGRHGGHAADCCRCARTRRGGALRSHPTATAERADAGPVDRDRPRSGRAGDHRSARRGGGTQRAAALGTNGAADGGSTNSGSSLSRNARL
jgi:hypothetical protein